MKIKAKLPILLASLFMVSALASCGGGTNDSNVLNIVYAKKGFDRVWIDQIAAKFVEDNPGITVNIRADANAESIISQNINKRNNKDDLYISVGSVWKTYAAEGKFADLSDFLNDEVDGTTVKDKVADEYRDSIYFTKSNGDKKCYRLPFTSGIGGIFYNKKMFDENNWDIPTTYDDLITLCETINNSRVSVPDKDDVAVKPFIYTGANTDYFDYTVFDWWSQIVGKSAIAEFLNYSSSDNFDTNKNQTYAALKTATEKWYQIFNPNSNYCVSDMETTTAEDAQKQFVNGYAAMMFNGDWLYNETLKYTDSGSFKNFELGLMKTPTLNEANADYVNTSYVIGEDQYIAIPASSTKKDLAKSFIKAVISNDGCQTFTKEAHGFLAYKCDYSSDVTDNNFMKDMIDLRNAYTTKFTNFSSSRLYLCGYVDIWCSSDVRPFQTLLNGTVTSVDKAFDNISLKATGNWSTWVANSK